MKNYRKTSHSIYDLKIHMVWITKYRTPVLFENVATRLRVLVREICKSVEIIRGHVSKDHVHLFMSVPPQVSVNNLAQLVKGKKARKLLSEYRKKFWDRHLWARGYFSASSVNVTDEIIMRYIEMQDMEEHARDDDFTISPLAGFQPDAFQDIGFSR